MLPEDVFEHEYASLVLRKDNGFDTCWVWLGDPSRVRKLRRAAWQYTKPENPHTPSLQLICGSEECVYPDHVYAEASEVGRMFFIERTSVRRGDCLIWQGPLSDHGHPRMRGVGKQKTVWRSVRRFVYDLEYGSCAKDGGIVTPSCGEALCVSHKHVVHSRDSVVV